VSVLQNHDTRAIENVIHVVITYLMDSRGEPDPVYSFNVWNKPEGVCNKSTLGSRDFSLF